MCPPKQCCCCHLVLGLTINCIVIACFIFLAIPGGMYSLSEIAFWCEPQTTDEHTRAYEAGETVSKTGDTLSVPTMQCNAATGMP
eukprot:COSAG01_NODE_2397_length_7771_cov_12.578076_10_plen_85_part_00